VMNDFWLCPKSYLAGRHAIAQKGNSEFQPFPHAAKRSWKRWFEPTKALITWHSADI